MRIDPIALQAAIDESRWAPTFAMDVENAIVTYLRVAEENKRWQKKRAKDKRLAEDRNLHYD